MSDAVRARLVDESAANALQRLIVSAHVSASGPDARSKADGSAAASLSSQKQKLPGVDVADGAAALDDVDASSTCCVSSDRGGFVPSSPLRFLRGGWCGVNTSEWVGEREHIFTSLLMALNSLSPTEPCHLTIKF